MNVRLHVNIDHVATIRQARGTQYPDPVWAAALVELAGAHGITIHLREDRRHIQDRDLQLLRQTVRSVLNLEMAATPEMVNIALEMHPDIVTLVPEKREERTTEGGLDLSLPKLGDIVSRLQKSDIRVSLFIEPTLSVIQAASKLDAKIVELHTGEYCEARGIKVGDELARLSECASQADALGMQVAAGHGLDYGNVRAVVQIPEVKELNIGHAIIARSIMVGLDRAVTDMLALLER